MRKFLFIVVGIIVFFVVGFLLKTHVLADNNITGTVFVDSNQNTVQDSGELGYSNATVELIQGRNTIVETLTTDANGNYSIDTSGIDPNSTYFIALILPDGYVETDNLRVNITNIVNSVQNFGIVPTPNSPLLAQDMQLQDVVCPIANGINCVAVGSENGGNANSIWTTSDNSMWTNVSNSFPHTVLTNIVCPNTNGIFCITVGNMNGNGAILNSIDGNNWISATFPNNNNSGDIYDGVACPNANGVFCIAV